MQALKAGVMEIADVICINKADHPQAKNAASEVRQILNIGHELDPDAPMPPIVMTRGDNGEGIEELKEKIEEHRKFLKESGRMEERHLASIKDFVLSWATNKMEKALQERLKKDDSELMEKVRRRELDPISAAETLYEEV